jgi:hypothetical protein
MALYQDVQQILDSINTDLTVLTLQTLTEASAMPAKLSAEGGRIWLDSPYYPAALTDIKAVPGRKYDPDTKRWSFPADQFQTVYALALKHFPSTKVQLLKLATQLAPAVLAAKAAKAAGAKSVTFEKYGKGWLVRNPYNSKFVDGMKNIPGRKWIWTEKTWYFPADMLDTVVKLAQDCYGADEVAAPPA